jgi:hypothetical protein
VNDIYRRFDLNMNRRLDEDELSQLGFITQNEFLHGITVDDFSASSAKFKGMAYVSKDDDPNNYGLTPYGFV